MNLTYKEARARRRRMAEAYAEDVPVADIAGAYDVTERTVWRAVHEAVLARRVSLRSPRRSDVTPAERKAAVAAYVAGEPPCDIAGRFRVARNTLLDWVHDAGEKIRRRGRPASGPWRVRGRR